MGLEQRTKKITGIVSLKGVEYQSIRPLLENYLSNSCHEYAFIYHGCDTLEDGQLKTPHIHFVANMKMVKRLSTILGEIAQVLGVSTLAVSISKYESFSACVQYLIHKNNADKFQYPKSDIVTNIEDSELDAFLEDDEKFDSDSLIKIVLSSPNRLAMLRTLGLGRYKLYRNVIADIENSVKGNKL